MVLGVSTVGLLLAAWGVLLVLLVIWLWRRGGMPRHAEGDPHVEVARIERRRGWDRRRIDLGPPEGLTERRRGFDRRGTLAGLG
jgi:hypothetical protein